MVYCIIFNCAEKNTERNVVKNISNFAQGSGIGILKNDKPKKDKIEIKKCE